MVSTQECIAVFLRAFFQAKPETKSAQAKELQASRFRFDAAAHFSSTTLNPPSVTFFPFRTCSALSSAFVSTLYSSRSLRAVRSLIAEVSSGNEGGVQLIYITVNSSANVADRKQPPRKKQKVSPRKQKKAAVWPLAFRQQPQPTSALLSDSFEKHSVREKLCTLWRRVFKSYVKSLDPDPSSKSKSISSSSGSYSTPRFLASTRPLLVGPESPADGDPHEGTRVRHQAL